MGAVLELENRFIRNIYLFTFGLTITVIIEALLKGKSSTLPIFLIGSAIGFSLFWSIEFAARQVVLTEKTKQTKYLLNMIFLGRYTVLGGLLYFLFNFLFASTDIILALLACVTICVTFFVVNWLNSKLSDAKLGDTKRITNVEMFNLASYGLKIVLAICIGYFVGKWIGRYLGNVEIGSYIGLAFGFAAMFVRGFRMEKQLCRGFEWKNIVVRLHKKHKTLKRITY
jgi:hypothetical protein